MARAKKDGKALNCNIDRQIYERLEEYCHEVGQTETLAIQRILGQFLNDYYEKSENSK